MVKLSRLLIFYLLNYHMKLIELLLPTPQMRTNLTANKASDQALQTHIRFKISATLVNPLDLIERSQGTQET
ncbi:MAG: hypothetical protein Q7Q71_04535 [Verrucomicrobiota bacterium JB023]|nr:hypothetical protein [Verrucomicrobiota bacterium JB023]